MGSCWRWLPINSVWSDTVSPNECCCWWCHFSYGDNVTRASTSLSAGGSTMHAAMVVIVEDCVTSERVLPNNCKLGTAWLKEGMAWQIVLCNYGRCMSNQFRCRGNVELVRSVLPHVLGGRWSHWYLFINKYQFWGQKRQEGLHETAAACSLPRYKLYSSDISSMAADVCTLRCCDW